MYCPNCGAPSQGRPYCTRCGKAQSQASQPSAVVKASASLTGRKLDEKYLLEERLGQGDAGVVYRARRLWVGDLVALKVLHPQQTHAAHAAASFQREAQAIARLRHPGIATLFDFGTTQHGVLYLAMELVEGLSLRDLLKQRGKLDEATAIEIALQLCDVLDAAHQQQIVHRDLKPENILVKLIGATVRVKLLDFGIARLSVNDPTTLRQTGDALGTPHYMSPEQCLGAPLDGRADLYSLGIVLYEMLCGAPPFAAALQTAAAIQQVNQPPQPIRERNPSVSPALEALLQRALAKQAAARPQTAKAFAQELRAARTKTPSAKCAKATVPLTATTTVAHAQPVKPTTALSQTDLSGKPLKFLFNETGAAKRRGTHKAAPFRKQSLWILTMLGVLTIALLCARAFKSEAPVAQAKENLESVPAPTATIAPLQRNETTPPLVLDAVTSVSPVVGVKEARQQFPAATPPVAQRGLAKGRNKQWQRNSAPRIRTRQRF